MPKTKISEFSATPANNTDIDSINIAEGCAPSGINDAIRELMAQLKDFQTGAVGDSFNGPVGSTTPAAGAFTTLTASSTLGVTGVTTLQAGTVALPALTTTGDTNTGIFFPAADTVATSVGGTEGTRLTSTGLGIGTSSPAYKLDLYSTSAQFTGRWGNATRGGHFYADSGGAGIFNTAAYGGEGIYLHAGSNYIDFLTNSTERARITSTGLFAIGTTTAVSGNTNARLVVKSTGAADACEVQASTNGVLGFDFRNSSGTQVGSIAINASTTSYNTSSDYRLKNTVTPMTGALAKVALLKPVTYKWNADGSDGEGFIAHELAEVCPYAVHGAKDALDSNGNPKYQGIDVSFLVATLTAAIQELKAEFDAYKALHP